MVVNPDLEVPDPDRGKMAALSRHKIPTVLGPEKLKIRDFQTKLSVAMTTRIIFETDGEINNWLHDRFDGFQKTPHYKL